MNTSLHLCGELANSWFVFTILCSDMALHAFSLMGILIDISSFHDNIELPPNYETISYSVSSSRSQQTRPCVPKATPYKGSPTVLWTSVLERERYGPHVIVHIENIILENFVQCPLFQVLGIHTRLIQPAREARRPKGPAR